MDILNQLMRLGRVESETKGELKDIELAVRKLSNFFFNQRCRPSSSLYILTYVHNTYHKLFINLNTPTCLSDKSPSSGRRRNKRTI